MMKTALHTALQRLLSEGGSQNFMIIHLDTDYYMQMAARSGSPEVLLESVSNHYLASQKQLGWAAQQKMIELGWNVPQQKEENYSIQAFIDSSAAQHKYITLLEETAKNVFGISEIQDAMIELVLE